MSQEHSFEVNIRLIDQYKFELDFGDFGQIESDEPPPLGEGQGPNPARLLASSVANCLSASLLFAIRKYKGQVQGLESKVSGALTRVDGRWRIAHMTVDIQLGADTGNLPHLDRVLAQFEDFCVVTQSVRAGIQVTTQIRDREGNLIHESQ